MYFIQASEKFLQNVLVTNKNATHQFYLTKVKVLNKYFGDLKVGDIKHDDVILFIVSERKRNPEITNNTLNKHIKTLKFIYKQVVGEPFKFKKLPENKPLPNILDDSVIQKVFSYLEYRSFIHKESHRNLVLFRLLLDTGLRINETLNLKLYDIDFESNTIHCTVTKSNSERYVFFTEKTKQYLIGFIKKHKHDSTYLFINYRGNKRLNLNNVQKICQRMKSSLSLRQSISPHSWRHTFATKFIKNGGDLETLRLLLGHTSISTTQIYLHLDKETLKKHYFMVNSKMNND